MDAQERTRSCSRERIPQDEVPPSGNTITIRVELVGKNPAARGSGTFFGLLVLFAWRRRRT